jgi:SAM-dependent methyltransferase
MLLRKIIREIFRGIITKKFITSQGYWEKRYYYGGNSGRGSYGEDARVKSNFLNDTLQNYNIENVVDIGCGDGNNLSYFNAMNYFGIDLSKTIIKKNKKKFINDKSKKFYLLRNNQEDIFKNINQSINKINTIILSFDVIFHLVEDKTYNDHLDFINNINASYCLVSSSDINIRYNSLVPHVRHRNYSKNMLLQGWNLIVSKQIPDCPDNREIKLFKKIKY